MSALARGGARTMGRRCLAIAQSTEVAVECHIHAHSYPSTIGRKAHVPYDKAAYALSWPSLSLSHSHRLVLVA